MWREIVTVGGWARFSLVMAFGVWWTHKEREYLGNVNWRSWE